ncbi:CAP domain-containing protein [Streptomyces sp. NP-1717]|uniref:CAP domain-containing protein n=1 Tax=Streptomyces sp. NP-1717 TaxID=2704470 RepID=UPI001F5D4CB1|nr:CAP domain-containing protein [Streptomyces sp. NP-1717]MCI3225940.1 RNA polymerase [Streptomyces sp. NP-1717]
MSSPFKASVVKAAQAGDRSAADRLGHESLPLVHQLVGHALHGHPEVDALARDTVRRVLGGLGELRRPADFRSHLVTTAVARIREHADYVYDLTLPRPDFDFVDLMISRLGLSGQHREVAEATRWVDREHHALVALWWLETSGELTRPEVAAALAANSQQVDARIERMWHELDTARVVVRALSAQPPCVLLEQLTGGWDGVPSPLWRERVARHTYDCTVCSGYAAGLVPADTLVAGLALVPVGDRGAPAAASYGDGGSLGGASGGGAAGGTVSSRAVPGEGSRTGARDALRRDRRAKRRRAVTVTAAVAALLTAGGVAQLVAGDGDEGDSRASTAVEPESLEPKSAASRTAESASPSPSRSSASPSPSPTRSPSKKAAPKPSKSTSAPRPSTADPAPKPDPTPTADDPKPGGGGGLAEQVTTLVNSERAKAGCGPVSTNSQLDTAALRHSQDMAAKGYFDHNSPDGKDPGDRITAAGYQWSTYGENIARGQQTAAQVMEGWMKSPGHRANILNCAFKEIGVGVHSESGGPWWTQAFGARG